MKTLTPTLSELVVQARFAQAQATPVPFGTPLRDAIARVALMLRGSDPEAARTDYLAGASDPADLERRADAWERAQAAYRTLPPAL